MDKFHVILLNFRALIKKNECILGLWKIKRDVKKRLNRISNESLIKNWIFVKKYVINRGIRQTLMELIIWNFFT